MRPAPRGPRHRLWRVRTDAIITATGGLERPLSFPGNDTPGVMLASALRDYVTNWGVSPGDRVVIVTNNDDAYRTALTVHEAGLTVACVVDARPGKGGDLVEACINAGIRVETGKAIAAVGTRGKRLKSVDICAQAGEGAPLETIECEAVAMSGGWSPVVHLWSHCGGKLLWSEENSHFYPDVSRFPTGDDGTQMVWTAGFASGAMSTPEVLENATKIATEVCEVSGAAAPAAEGPERGPHGPRLGHAAGRGQGEKIQDVAGLPERR